MATNLTTDNVKSISELSSAEYSDDLLLPVYDSSSSTAYKVTLGTLKDGVSADMTEATEAANEAAEAANDAAQSATDASTTAGNAAQSASDAASTAKSAATAATEAAEAANDAATAANTAATAANEAASDASTALTLVKQLGVLPLDLIIDSTDDYTTSGTQATESGGKIAYHEGNDFVYILDDTIYPTWSESCDGLGSDVYADKSAHAYLMDGTLYQYDSSKNTLVAVGTGNVGNVYNVTNEIPLSSGYYTLATAAAAVYAAGYAVAGIQITFAVASGEWETWQFTADEVSESTFTDEGNWTEGTGSGVASGAVLNIADLCGSGTYYTLTTALAALNSKQEEDGVTYIVCGVVITYPTAENTWATKQFTGTDVSNASEEGLWTDFGGSSSSITVSDEPVSGGTNAFSTGGAFTNIPANLSGSYADNVLKLALVNAGGTQIGDELQLGITGGSSSGSGTVVAINFETSPLYGQAGGTIVIKASIMSITTTGSTESYNSIETLYLYDRSTGELLETLSVNQASSADTETYDFEIDVSSYLTSAGTLKFQIKAEDDGGNTATKNINVTGVDVTVTSPQTLNYTTSTYVPVGGSRTLSMYRFANNASSQGITCVVEAYINGEWVTFGTSTISDTYAHSITVNAASFCGVTLGHGAVPLRIHGEDVASGVVGNYLYTHIMVVDSSDETPIVVTRWTSEDIEPTFQQYETAEMDYAAYCSAKSTVAVEIVQTVDGEETVMQEVTCSRGTTYTYTQRVEGFDTDGSVTFALTARDTGQNSETYPMNCLVSGSVVDVEATEGALFEFDFSSRSNSDSDLSIVDGDYELTLEGANYSTNGFVKDSYGDSTYGTSSDTGVMALRIAENVTGSLNYTPFSNSYISTVGMACQFKIRVKNVADDDAVLMSCISGGVGFYVTGTKVIFTTDNGATTTYTIEAAIPDDTAIDVMIVIEPTAVAPYSGIGVAKMYFDGELIGTCQYTTSSLTTHSTIVTFDGTNADLYLYSIRAWETYFSYEEAFDNYLTKMSDVDEMVDEYEFNDVMASQTAENQSAKSIPQAESLYNLGLAYFVLCKNGDTGTGSDQYPEYLETLDGDKKTTRTLDVYAYFPDRPWQDFKAIGCTVSNQGTTSSQRPIKNVKIKLKSATITLLNTYEEGDDNYDKYVECLTNAANHKVQPIETSIPTNIITVKVDYSESGGANNGASTQMFNELQRALGSNYMTPAQNAYKGDYTLNTSIDSIPVAFFRTDYYSTDATSPTYGYFHAKGNWNDDKGDPAVFGFEGVEGYNADCLNYGDFTEHIAAQGQSLSDYDSELDKSSWDTSAVHVLTEFCGEGYIVYRYQEGAWTDTTGTMTYDSTNGWVIEGDVLNPVSNYELLTYDALDWFQGVNSVDDMLAATSDSDSTPIWLQYFESRYPDDDDLNSAYEDGRKVPYCLYKWLLWCQQCNHNLTADDGDITIDGVTYEGTAENRLLKFKRELHNEANVYSMICYHVFTDYMAAVDQRSKNMMVGFYLDTDGVRRMYLNHLYDGDTILGSDNDCGLTIPALLDPNDDPNGYYQGHDSVLFTQLAASDYIWLSDYESDSDTSDSTKTVTVATIAAAMRSVTTDDGVAPFSKDGIEKYWIDQRLSKWPKLVSSYDGLRKYVENSTADANYFFALHGLSIQRLRDYVDQRFTFRDGYYQCGDIYDSCVSVRAVGTNMSVTITAAKAGYFGIGLDQANSFYASAYLDEGGSATFETGATNTGSGNMIYIYGANCIGELDLTNATPISLQSISEMVLCQRLLIGGADFSVPNSSLTYVTEINLGVMPFLTELDIRNYPCTSVTATYCPRLVTLEASGSALTSFTLAETSPIETLSLPETIQTLSFVNLPNLTYPNGGLTFDGLANVTSLEVSGCENIDEVELLGAIKDAGATLKYISLSDIYLTESLSWLQWLMESGTLGLDSEYTDVCDGLSGTWICDSYEDEDDIAEVQTYFPELVIYNQQYTLICFHDDVEDEAYSMSNMSNETGYAYDNDYEASGHVQAIYDALTPAIGTLNTATGQWVGKRLSDSKYTLYADGTTADPTDANEEGADAMMLLPHCWYKGINDFKNDRKYHAWSSEESEPISSASVCNRYALSECLYQSGAYFLLASCAEGAAITDCISSASAYNAYKVDVEGMKQVRFPFVNSSLQCAAFVDADGLIVGTFNFYKSDTDFVVGDYVFTDVPDGAVAMYFGCSTSVDDDTEVIAVDSSEIEAIEPDWVESPESLVGIYEGGLDGSYNFRSVSGVSTRVGTGTSTNYSWTYDSDGNPTDTIAPAGTSYCNYTGWDFMMLARMRGDGYQCIDYEQSKFLANLWWAMNGVRDDQEKCGYGRSTTVGTTGYADSIGKSDSYKGQYTSSTSGNKILGIESLSGGIWEGMDNVAVNVGSFAHTFANHGVADSSTDSADGVWHIYDPQTASERTVQGLTSGSGYNIARVKNGRFMDTVPSKVSSDNSTFRTYYCAYWSYSSSTGRRVGRSSYGTYAYGGLAYASANYAFSGSHTNFGSRLAFRGDIAISD